MGSRDSSGFRSFVRELPAVAESVRSDVRRRYLDEMGRVPAEPSPSAVPSDCEPHLEGFLRPLALSFGASC